MPPQRENPFDRLVVRLLLFLSIALLPLGLIAVAQTMELTSEVRNRTNITLEAMTERAAARNRELIQETFGAAKALSGLIEDVGGSGTTCNDLMRRFVEINEKYLLAAWVQSPGRIRCSSDYQSRHHDQNRMDVRDSPIVQEALREQAPTVVLAQSASFPDVSIIGVLQPIFSKQREYLGYIAITLPHTALAANVVPPGDGLKEVEPVDILIFNEHGEILSTSKGFDDVTSALPKNRALKNFAGVKSTTFVDHDATGVERTFAVVPIIEGKVYALGTWEYNAAELSLGSLVIPAAVFPVLMWLASLIVSYFAVHSLVIQHIRRLRRRMMGFARLRQFDDDSALGATAPAELSDLDRVFRTMAINILHDEARLEDMVHEKNVLLKEVHHRVKNNLQLIASIINIQLRKLSTGEARVSLRRIQERVLGLATIHRNLYQTDTLTAVRGDVVLREVVNQIWNIGVSSSENMSLQLDLKPLILLPDQAVPLSLLASEAVTNAIKYVGADDSGSGWVRVSLEVVDGVPQQVTLRISNSIGAHAPRDSQEDTPGLGQRLIRAFTTQIDGVQEVHREPGLYTLIVEFSVAPFEAENVETGDFPLISED